MCVRAPTQNTRYKYKVIDILKAGRPKTAKSETISKSKQMTQKQETSVKKYDFFLRVCSKVDELKQQPWILIPKKDTLSVVLDVRNDASVVLGFAVHKTEKKHTTDVRDFSINSEKSGSSVDLLRTLAVSGSGNAIYDGLVARLNAGKDNKSGRIHTIILDGKPLGTLRTRAVVDNASESDKITSIRLTFKPRLFISKEERAAARKEKKTRVRSFTVRRGRGRRVKFGDQKRSNKEADAGNTGASTNKNEETKPKGKGGRGRGRRGRGGRGGSRGGSNGNPKPNPNPKPKPNPNPNQSNMSASNTRSGNESFLSNVF